MKNLTLGKRMAAGFGGLVLIAVVLGVISVRKMGAIEKDSLILTKEFIPEVTLCNEIERAVNSAVLDIRTYGLTFDGRLLESGKKKLEEVKKALNETRGLADRSPHLLKLKESVGRVDARLNEYENMVNETAKKAQAIEQDRKELLESAGTFTKMSEEFLVSQKEQMRDEIKSGANAAKLEERLSKISLMEEIVDLNSAVRIAVWNAQAQRDVKIANEVRKNFDLIEKKLAELKAATKKAENLSQIEAINSSNTAYGQELDGLLGNWLALDQIGKKRHGVTLAALEVVENVAREGAKETIEIAERSASRASSASLVMTMGALGAAVTGTILAFLITFSLTRTIKRIVGELSEGAHQLSSASDQVASASQQLAEGASEQAATLEEISASIEEMTSSSHETAELTGGAAQLMNENIDKSARSLTSLIELTREMSLIEQDSEKIGTIIKTIDGIAFQTNLLALNAAVEAARAGEAGAGFAVVADEVRNLAVRATEAAKSTQGLLEGTVERVKSGAEALRHMSDDFDGIVTSATIMGEKTRAITVASKQQSQGIQQINDAMHQLDTVTQNNASTSEESAAAAEELSAQAKVCFVASQELAVMAGVTLPEDGRPRESAADTQSPQREKILKSLPGID